MTKPKSPNTSPLTVRLTVAVADCLVTGFVVDATHSYEARSVPAVVENVNEEATLYRPVLDGVVSGFFVIVIGPPLDSMVEPLYQLTDGGGRPMALQVNVALAGSFTVVDV